MYLDALFFLKVSGRLMVGGRLESAVRDRVWYALVRHDIDIPIPPRAIHVSKAGRKTVSRREERRIAQQERALGYIDFFDHLPDATRRKLAGRARTRLYAEQEVIVRQGDTVVLALLGAARRVQGVPANHLWRW